MIYLRLEENSPLGFHHPIFVCFIHFSPPLYRVYKKPSCFFPFSFLQICFNSFLSLSYQLRFVWKISAIKMWLLIIMVQNNGSSGAAIVIHSENTNLRSKGSSRLHVGMLFFCLFSVCTWAWKKDFCEKIATFSRWIEPLPFCHELLWLLGEEVRAYFSCPPLFEQNILFYDISFLFLTQMTPKTALG